MQYIVTLPGATATDQYGTEAAIISFLRLTITADDVPQMLGKLQGALASLANVDSAEVVVQTFE